MRRDEVVALLRKFAGMKATVERLEVALGTLEECERDIIETIYMFPKPYAADKMCEKYMIERATVYRRGKKALEKLEKCFGKMGDKSETTKAF